jgi:hypothetical protein
MEFVHDRLKRVIWGRRHQASASGGPYAARTLASK